MKLKDIVKKYELDEIKFENWCRIKRAGKDGIMGYAIDDDNVQKIVEEFLAHIKEETEKKQAEEDQEIAKQIAKQNMLVSSGFSFDGYKILHYSGYVAGDYCMTMPRDNFFGTNNVSTNLCQALQIMRNKAIDEMLEEAYNVGCNAIIGLNFNYMTMDPLHLEGLTTQHIVFEPYVICVTANGNAVLIEKE